MTQTDNVLGDIARATQEITPDLINIRRWMHKNPELAFEEVKTSEMIKGKLDEMGIPWQGGFGKTGLCATVGHGDGPCIALRGDFDALPILETADPAYKSLNDGKMHACGHDAHTAILLGVVNVLSRIENLPGKAMFIFQPAEETLSGARAMLDDGLFDFCEPDVVLGYHNWPPLPGGTVGWHTSTVFASTDPFDIQIKGKSGHGAHPHLSKDPIVAAAHLIEALQTIVSREVAPINAAVVSIGCISGGTTRAQIPDTVTLQGTTRAQQEGTRRAVKEAIQRICSGVAITSNLEITPIFLESVPAVIQTPDVIETVCVAAESVLGADRVIELPQGSMGSEDFAEFAALKPAAHLRIGSRFGDRETMLHRSDFDLDEQCIPTGVKVLSTAMLKLMARN